MRQPWNYREVILTFARYPMLTNFRTIGSVENHTDNEDSDLNLYADADENTTLFDIGNAIEDLEDLLDVRVNIVTSKAEQTKWRLENLLAGREMKNNG